MRLRLLLVLVLCCYQPGLLAADSTSDRIERGRYLLRAAGCAACHTDSENKGEFLAGGRKLTSPFGTFVSPNITPDKEHGIGNWTDEDFIRALGDGVSPAGDHYYPAFPYTSYTRMGRDDMLVIKAYLFSIKPVPQANPDHDLTWYASRMLMGLWKWLYFTPGAHEPDTSKSARWQRGDYLVNALSHCAECHSPRNSLGALIDNKLFIGVKDGPEGETAPNITPDKDTGIGKWSSGELETFLQSGELPDGDYTGGLMAEVVDEGLSYLDRQDIEAMVEYLQSLKPVYNRTD
jgi:mono/diheme cytochrome c family protein